jgi:hypothetical protein
MCTGGSTRTRWLALAIVVAIGGCTQDAAPPRCVLPGDYRLAFALEGRIETLALHVPDPMERFRPARGKSDEWNAEQAKAWFVAQLGAELTAPIPALGLELDTRLFTKPDLPRCALAIDAFTAAEEMIQLAFEVDARTGAVTGRLTGTAANLVDRVIDVAGTRTALEPPRR